MTDTCPYALDKPIECTTPRVNLNDVEYGLWVVIMYQCSFINYNKCTTLVGDVNGGDCACGGAGGIWELSVLYTQFCCEFDCSKKFY